MTAVRQRIKFKTEQKGHTDIGTSDVKLEMEQEQADMNSISDSHSGTAGSNADTDPSAAHGCVAALQ
jgi:hypothetical protein